MIGPADEYFCHQIVAPATEVASADRNWQDRFYFNFNDPAKELSGILAMGFFPNMNLFQGILNLATAGKLICKNYFRPINNDRLRVWAGSLQVEVTEPMRRWEIKLHEPALNVALDLAFAGRSEPFEFGVISWEREGVKVWDQCHYTQAGEFQGTLQVGNRSFTRLVGVRDRSWGIRNLAQIDFWIWISANFKDCWLTAWLGETRAGELITLDGAICQDDGSRDAIKAFDYEIAFRPGMRTPSSSSYLITTASGRKFRLLARALHTLYVSIHNGIYDLADPKVLSEKDRTTQIFDQTQEFDLEGSAGIGMIEFFVMGGCHRYPESWPAMR